MNGIGRFKRELTSLLITMLIVFLLISSAPAGAVNLRVTIPSTVEQGKSLDFNLEIEIAANERIKISNITFVLNCGGNVYNYTVDAGGNYIAGDAGIFSVNKIAAAPQATYGYGYLTGYGYIYGYGYGYVNYGYGYGYGAPFTSYLNYSVSIDTGSLPVGSCNIEIFVWTDGKAFYTQKSFEVKKPAVVAPPVGEITPGSIAVDNTVDIGITYIPKGVEEELAIPEESTLYRYIEKITLIAEKSLAGFIIKVKLIEEPPKEIPKIENAYRFFEITSPIKEGFKAKIKFKVEKKWIEENDIDKNKVYMYRYREAWEKLDTRKIDEDDGYVYYEAVTTGFSYYAIAGEKVVAKPPEIKPPEVKPPKPPEVKPPKPPEVKPPKPPEEVKPPAPTPVPPKPTWVKYAVIAIIIVAIIAIIAVLYLRKKE